MRAIHLSKELLDAIAAGRGEPELLQELLFEHLAERCPVCGDAIEAWTGWRRTRGTARDAVGVVEALRLLLAGVPAAGRQALEARKRAREDLETLRPLSHPERLGRIDRGLTRFRGPELAALCLEEARRFLPARPRQAWEWAVVAEEAALWAHGPQQASRADSLRALAAAHQGNALRILERFPTAERHFARAAELVRLGRVTGLRVLAEIHCLEASLYRCWEKR